MARYQLYLTSYIIRSWDIGTSRILMFILKPLQTHPPGSHDYFYLINNDGVNEIVYLPNALLMQRIIHQTWDIHPCMNSRECPNQTHNKKMSQKFVSPLRRCEYSSEREFN